MRIAIQLSILAAVALLLAVELAGLALHDAWRAELAVPLAPATGVEQAEPWTPYAAVPRPCVAAIVASEDPGFWTHGGYDFARHLRAAGGVGSTLTQQVVRDRFPRSTRHLTGDRLLDPARLEARYSKEEIVEVYVNSTFYGRRTYGIAGASRMIFDRDLGDLGLPECAFLAALVTRPIDYSPFHPVPERQQRGRERGLERTRWVLGQLHEGPFAEEARRLLADGFVLEFAEPR